MIMNMNILIILVLSLLIGCSAPPYKIGKIKIKGSDTMLNLTRLLAEEYMKTNPGISIYVEGGGSATGINALINKQIDISTASRTIRSEEIKLLAEKNRSLGISTLIAKDALSIYINKNNPVKNFSVEELKKIFLCEITYWNELGGTDNKIVPIIRPTNSGTHLYFKEHVLNGQDYCSKSLVKQTTKQVIEEVNKNSYAIGYGGIGYKENVDHALINWVEASADNVVNDTYPLSRYLYFYTLSTPRGILKDFIDWVISPVGQKIISSAGYIPIWISN